MAHPQEHFSPPPAVKFSTLSWKQRGSCRKLERRLYQANMLLSWEAVTAIALQFSWQGGATCSLPLLQTSMIPTGLSWFKETKKSQRKLHVIKISLRMLCLWVGKILQIKSHLSLHWRQKTTIFQESLMNILNSWDNPSYSKLLIIQSKAMFPKSLITK